MTMATANAKKKVRDSQAEKWRNKHPFFKRTAIV